jgi:hypothetical protein
MCCHQKSTKGISRETAGTWPPVSALSQLQWLWTALSQNEEGLSKECRISRDGCRLRGSGQHARRSEDKLTCDSSVVTADTATSSPPKAPIEPIVEVSGRQAIHGQRQINRSSEKQSAEVLCRIFGDSALILHASRRHEMSSPIVGCQLVISWISRFKSWNLCIGDPDRRKSREFDDPTETHLHRCRNYCIKCRFLASFSFRGRFECHKCTSLTIKNAVLNQSRNRSCNPGPMRRCLIRELVIGCFDNFFVHRYSARK